MPRLQEVLALAPEHRVREHGRGRAEAHSPEHAALRGGPSGRWVMRLCRACTGEGCRGPVAGTYHGLIGDAEGYEHGMPRVTEADCGAESLASLSGLR